MKLKYMMIGVLVTGVVILGILSYLGGMEGSYGEDIDLTGFNDTMDRVNTQSILAEEMWNETQSLPFESSATLIFYAPYEMLKMGWKIIKMFANTITTFEAMISDSFNNLTGIGITIPGWLLGTIMAIILIILVVIFIEMYFRWKLE